MERQSVFRAVMLLKHTDIEMAEAFIRSFDFSGFTHAGSYQRDVVTIMKGSVKVHRICIPRVRIRDSMSKRTMAVFLTSLSNIVFILFVLS